MIFLTMASKEEGPEVINNMCDMEGPELRLSNSYSVVTVAPCDLGKAVTLVDCSPLD